MQLLILYTVFHFAITHDTYAVADHKGYHVYGIVECITPTLPVYLAIHFVHIIGGFRGRVAGVATPPFVEKFYQKKVIFGHF